MRALGLVIVLSHAAFGQAPAKTPEFEVADVQVSKSTNPEQGKGRMLPGGRIEVPNTTLKNLMMAAYSVQENMITGGPAWLESDRFDIVAKAPPDTPPETLFLMLRSLLADRFKLAIHREDKPMPVYAMVVGKSGPNLQKAAGGQQTCRWITPGNGRVQRECKNMTMQQLAIQIPGWGMAHVDLPVVDLTEIQGAYDFQLEWSLPSGRGDAGKGDAPAAAEMGGSTIFDAMSQIGLKLEQRKRPMSVIVIDHAERVPTAN
ncbi:exported hypothetical protein [Candidatus Sulfopaludibacter sp. SbA3]|nr:exported hypothetical protein [Candidatus Sulfopaludibacter sp. SbA3]